MDTQSFNALFLEELAEPLRDHGLDRVGKGHTLRFLRGANDLRLLRLGGRLQVPGAMVTVICFRHNFLRPVNGDDPSATTLYAGDFPRKHAVADFDSAPERGPAYRPHNLGRWPRDVFPYADASEDDVRRHLTLLREAFATRILPWAAKVTPEHEFAQLRANGEGAWCERRWIEDYERAIAPDPDPDRA